MYRVILVDDHTVVRQGIARLVDKSADLELVGEASSGQEALDLLAGAAADLLVTDLDMPGGGLGFITRVHEAQPDVRILVLSQHSEREFALRALSAGARGYVSKLADADTLEDAMHKVASGRPYLSEEARELALEQITGGDDRSEPHARLSARELEVLGHLARGMRVGEIADELGISIKTVSTHRTRILEKLGLTSTVDLALYAREHDLV